MTSNQLDSGETTKTLLNCCALAVKAEAVTKSRPKANAPLNRKKGRRLLLDIPFIAINPPLGLPLEPFDICQELALFIVKHQHLLLLFVVAWIGLESLP